MKYIFLRLSISHGEYEFYSQGLYEVEDTVDPAAFARTIASHEYDREDIDWETGMVEETHTSEVWEGFDPDIYWFNGGEFAVKPVVVQEVPAEHYDILKQYV